MFFQIYYLSDNSLLSSCFGHLNVITTRYEVNHFSTSHSMATADLKKSEDFVTNTTAPSKYIPRRTKISINWNPTFQMFFWSKFTKIKIFKNFRIAPKLFFAFQYIKNWTKVFPWNFFLLLKKKIFSPKKTLKKKLLVGPNVEDFNSLWFWLLRGSPFTLW